MSFRERTAWIGLAILLIVWGWYFATAWGALASGDAWPADLLVRCVIVSGAASIGLPLLASLRDPETLLSIDDEREINIESRGTAVAYNCLFLLAVVAVVAGVPILADSARVAALRVDPAVLIANGVVLFLVIAEFVRMVVVVALHRRAR